MREKTAEGVTGMGEGRYTPPIYLQIREIVRNNIEEGVYPPGTAIPSENDLADTYGSDRHQVRNAIDALVHEGLLKRVPGKGVYVLSGKMERNLDDLQGFTQTMLEDHVVPSFKIMAKTPRKAGMKYSILFGIRPEDQIYYVKRVCYANSEPVSLEEIIIPHYVVPKLGGIDLTVFSIYEVYNMYGIKVDRARQTLDIVHPDQNDARMLDLEPGMPVMLFQCTTYDDLGRVIEFDRNYARGDKCNFSVRFNR